jgi:hypothetical protein
MRQAQEGHVADERETDRLAGELLDVLKGSLARPGGLGRPQPSSDDNSMLSMIKDVLKQQLPGGARPREEAGTTAAQGGGATAFHAPVTAGNVAVDWTGMYRRQEAERESMYARQEREREELQRRQVGEMEAFAGIRTVTSPAVRPVVERPRRPAARPRPASRKFGIVPGTSIGNWAVETESGTKTFTAVSDEQAMREARRYGLTPTSARLIDTHTYTAEEMESMRSSFGVAGMRESAEAEFEKAIKIGLIPENAVFERLPNREWGYRIGDNPTVRKGADLVRKRPF